MKKTNTRIFILVLIFSLISVNIASAAGNQKTATALYPGFNASAWIYVSSNGYQRIGRVELNENPPSQLKKGTVKCSLQNNLGVMISRATYVGSFYESNISVECGDIVGNSGRIVMFTTHETTISGVGTTAEYGVVESQGLK